ncbi:hypothetical protein HYALB_00011735 [Hymenoscyphus albidus]|uniref:Uncharacterized protein n=1 Tax=Hymenoscyphus albidus TaxID=595503 RepID=A0A9N9Q947_9HELO|nr:hypothetical protein HYALB_00011735 [Hymenoscyphus albidus]
MSSARAFLAVLALAGSSFAAPVAYDDGQYHPPTKFDDGSWDAPTAVAPVSTPTKAPAPITTPVTTQVKPVTTPPPTKITSIVVKPTTTAPKPAPTVPSGGNTSNGPSGTKQHYTGDGSSWPSSEKWLTFDTLWNLNKDGLSKGCGSGIKQNTPEEILAIHDGILSESKSTGVDSRFILAVIVQESHGCVRVGATNLGVNNPGIMQSHNGPNDCTKVGSGPCPKEKIVGMIHDGTFGTAEGSGLKHGIEWAGQNGATSEAQRVYWSSRLYNSGDFSYKKGDDLSNPPDATPAYSSDIANRLLGFVF